MKFSLHNHDNGTPRIPLDSSLISNVVTKEEVKASNQCASLPIRLPPGQTFSDATLRNSFYISSISGALSREHEIYLSLKGSGSCLVNAYIQESNGKVSLLKSFNFQSDGDTISTQEVLIFNLCPSSKVLRVFVDIKSYGCTIYDISYQTTMNSSLRKTVFLLRTFGNTYTIIDFLKRVGNVSNWEYKEDAASLFFENTLFAIYDSTPGASDVLADELKNLNANYIFQCGPNLGGGGNASLNLRFAHEHILKSQFVDKLEDVDFVFLDDDVTASSESLYRVFAFNQLKTSSVTYGSPIYMVSEPNVLWENGGWWGKQFSQFSEFTSVTPQLNMHGLRFNSNENLHKFVKATPIDYITFNLFCFSGETFQKVGYPSAFFLRGDDVDMSLRCKDVGSLITNPNLAVWQEPAHSYWQEYMAFMHGLIINAAHGNWSYQEFIREITLCFTRHLKLNDFFGMNVYFAILNDILTSEELFGTNFADLYLQRRRDFSVFEKQFISHDVFMADSKKHLSISFLHDDVILNDKNLLIALRWDSAKKTYIYDPFDSSVIEKVSKLSLNFFELVNSFALDEGNNKVQDIVSRYKLTQTQEFWDAIVENNSFSPLHFKRFELAQLLSQYEHCSTSLNSIELDQAEFKSNALGYLSDHFDAESYLLKNPDVAEAGLDPLEHYINYGIKENRIY